MIVARFVVYFCFCCFALGNSFAFEAMLNANSNGGSFGILGFDTYYFDKSPTYSSQRFFKDDPNEYYSADDQNYKFYYQNRGRITKSLASQGKSKIADHKYKLSAGLYDGKVKKKLISMGLMFDYLNNNHNKQSGQYYDRERFQKMFGLGVIIAYKVDNLMFYAVPSLGFFDRYDNESSTVNSYSEFYYTLGATISFPFQNDGDYNSGFTFGGGVRMFRYSQSVPFISVGFFS